MSDMSGIGGARVRLDGDASGVVNAANQSNAALRSLGNNVAQNWWGLRNLSLAFAALPAAAAAGMGLALRSAIQFETAMAGVERTTYNSALSAEENAASLANLNDQILEIARITPVATNAIAGIAESAGALGVAQEDVAAFTRVVADLAATTDLTEDSAATNLARIASLTGITAAGYDNLASAILEAGRTTAATESEIVGAATKLAGIAGLRADQVIAIGAALRSAGVETSSGTTAIIKSLTLMRSAVDEGGEKLELFARTANVSSEAFAQAFREDPSKALLLFVQGLGQASAAGEATNAVLKELELSDVRVLRALNGLAKAEQSTANESVRLSNILKVTNNAFVEGTAITDIAQKRYKTFQSQVQILKNNLFELGVILGNTVLPVLKTFVNFALSFVTGLRAMPGPLRAVIVGLGLFVAALSAVVSVAILFGARIALALGALSRMQQISASAGGGLKGLAAQFTGVSAAANTAGTSIDRATAAMARNTAASASARRANAALPAGVMVGPIAPVLTTKGNINTAATAAKRLAVENRNAALIAAQQAQQTQAVATAQQTAIKTTTGLTRSIGFLGKVAGGLGFALTALVAVTTIWGGAQRKVEERQRALFGKSDELVKAMREEAAGVSANTDAWILNAIAKRDVEAGSTKAIQTAEKLGISYKTLQSIIKGDLTSQASVQAIKTIEEASKAGVPGAKALGDTVVVLTQQYAASAEEAEVVRKATGGLTQANAAAEDSVDALADALARNKEILEAQAQATHDYISAVFAERSSAIALVDATQELARARTESSRRGEEEARISRSIAQARRDEAQAYREVAESFENLFDARADGIKAEMDADDDLYAANRRYEDLLRDIAKQEKDLTKLRQGPSLKDLIAATNKLRDAQLRLRDAEQYVLDAEWQLQYLREEGSSSRDILDAENALEDAQQDVANASEDATNAQEELNDVRDGASAEEIAEAERALQDAYRESRSAYQEIINAEEKLAEIRRANASDQFYLDAQADYEEAQARVQDAIQRTKDAERELQELRDKNYALEQAKSELALEQALFDRAKAIVEVKKQQELMKDGTFSAAEEAHALADALTLVAGEAPSSEARRRLLAYAAALRQVKEVGEDTGAAFLPTGPTPVGDPTKGLAPLGPVKAPSLDFSGWTAEIEKNLPLLVSGLLGTVGLVFGPLGAAAGAAIGYGLGKVMQELVDTDFMKRHAENLVAGFVEPFRRRDDGSIWGRIRGVFFGLIGAIREVFGISSPSRVMAEIGAQLVQGLVNGIIDGVGSLFRSAFQIGGSLIGGIIGGISGNLSTLWGWLGNVFNTITGYFSGAGRWLWNAGGDLLRGLYNGLVEAGGWFRGLFINFLKSLIPGPLQRFFGISSPSKLMAQYGNYIMQGLERGILDEKDSVIKTMQDFSKSLAGSVDRHAFTGINTLSGLGTIQSLAPASGVTDASSSVVNNTTNYNLEAINAPAPRDIIEEFMWAEQIATRD